MTLGRNKMILPEERVQMDKARMEKSQQIQRFADAKTEQIIKTSAFNGAVDLVSAGFLNTGSRDEAIANPEMIMVNIKEIADKLEAELRRRILGEELPF